MYEFYIGGKFPSFHDEKVFQDLNSNMPIHLKSEYF